jgi:membrane fusion protein (multidrug efflux system)
MLSAAATISAPQPIATDGAAYIHEGNSLVAADQIAILDGIARMNHAIDANDYPLYASFYTDDGVIDSGFGPPSVGRAALIASRDQSAPFITNKQHVVGNPVISGAGDKATVTYYLTVFERRTGLTLAGTADITDPLRRAGGRWRIASHTTRMDPATLNAMKAAMDGSETSSALNRKKVVELRCTVVHLDSQDIQRWKLEKTLGRWSHTDWMFVGFVSLALAGCTQPAPPPPPPPEVEVLVIRQQPLADIIELPGRVAAVRVAEVRARVDGIVERRLYSEGSDVRAGQALFRIDPRERRADYAAALATLRRNEATAANADQVVARYSPLVNEQAISKQEYDSAVSQQRISQADVANARAQVDRARLALSYTNVTAPISGRVGRADVTEGALVSASAATLLTRIEQLDPVFVNLGQSSSDLIAIRRDIASGRIDSPGLGRVVVRLTLEDGTPYGPEGVLNFADLSIDETSGTASLRAEFPNPGYVLVPGQFVRARISAGTFPNAITVPQPAVSLNARGASVMVVGPKNVAEARPVTLGELIGGDWIVTSGLKPGDRVIVNGLQKVRPGAPVTIARPQPAPARQAQAGRR